MTPQKKAEVVQIALLDAQRHGKPGDADALLKYLKENPHVVEELATKQAESKTVPASAAQ